MDQSSQSHSLNNLLCLIVDAVKPVIPTKGSSLSMRVSQYLVWATLCLSCYRNLILNQIAPTSKIAAVDLQ